MAWLLFLFCWLLFEVYRAFYFTGSWARSTKGLDLVLPDFTVRVEDVLALEAGTPLQVPDVDPSLDQFIVLTIGSLGDVSLRGSQIDFRKPLPWSSSGDDARKSVVFLRTLPGATYGDVVRVLDHLRTYELETQTEIGSVILVKFEPSPTPNTSFQRTLTRGGFGPLNSDR